MFELSDEYRRWSENLVNFVPIVPMIPEYIVADIIKKFDWKHVAIVEIEKAVTTNEHKLKMDRIETELPHICFDYRNLSLKNHSIYDSNKMELFETLKRDQSVKAVVIKGM